MIVLEDRPGEDCPERQPCMDTVDWCCDMDTVCVFETGEETCAVYDAIMEVREDSLEDLMEPVRREQERDRGV